MRKLVCCFVFLGLCFTVKAQPLTLKKGIILDSLKIGDGFSDSYALFLPKSFDVTKKWPVLFVFDKEGKGKQVLQKFVQAAENQGYIMAASNSVHDSVSMTENVFRASRMMNKVMTILPVNGQRIYTAGFSEGAKFASLVPMVMKNVAGVLGINGAIANADILNGKHPFYYIGIIGGDDFQLFEMKLAEKVLNQLRFPNQLFVYHQGIEPSEVNFIEKALEDFTLSSMAKGFVEKEQSFIDESYKTNLDVINKWIAENRLLEADQLLTEILEIYGVHKDIEELKIKQKHLRKDKVFKALKRSESNAAFKEANFREDFNYLMYEDISAYNFNNLGWWNYQMQELQKYSESENVSQKLMGKRLIGFVNHLVDSHISELQQEKVIDEDGLSFLWMLKTITNPKDFEAYISIISYSSKAADFETALFYLEELLKVGYVNNKELYSIEGTALLRITPEYNALIEKYLKEARYDVMEQ